VDRSLDKLKPRTSKTTRYSRKKRRRTGVNKSQKRNLQSESEKERRYFLRIAGTSFDGQKSTTQHLKGLGREWGELGKTARKHKRGMGITSNVRRKR